MRVLSTKDLSVTLEEKKGIKKTKQSRNEEHLGPKIPKYFAKYIYGNLFLR